jgi:vacuolar-type H+-ATPase subunit H
MAEAARSRGDVLRAIQKAELEGAAREERASAKAAQVRASTQAECSSIIEQAEKDARAGMRKAVDVARKECAGIREERMRESDKESQISESAAMARMQGVYEMIQRKFAREFDVKD